MSSRPLLDRGGVAWFASRRRRSASASRWRRSASFSSFSPRRSCPSSRRTQAEARRAAPEAALPGPWRRSSRARLPSHGQRGVVPLAGKAVLVAQVDRLHRHSASSSIARHSLADRLPPANGACRRPARLFSMSAAPAPQRPPGLVWKSAALKTHAVICAGNQHRPVEHVEGEGAGGDVELLLRVSGRPTLVAMIGFSPTMSMMECCCSETLSPGEGAACSTCRVSPRRRRPRH